MPRRRKGAASERKHPLDFCESPFVILHRQSTPVHSSVNPITADVVPIEEYPNVWISPQFDNKLINGERGAATCRITRRRQPSNSTTQRHISPDPNRFKPLKFTVDSPLRNKSNKSQAENKCCGVTGKTGKQRGQKVGCSKYQNTDNVTGTLRDFLHRSNKNLCADDVSCNNATNCKSLRKSGKTNLLDNSSFTQERPHSLDTDGAHVNKSVLLCNDLNCRTATSKNCLSIRQNRQSDSVQYLVLDRLNPSSSKPVITAPVLDPLSPELHPHSECNASLNCSMSFNALPFNVSTPELEQASNLRTERTSSIHTKDGLAEDGTDFPVCPSVLVCALLPSGSKILTERSRKSSTNSRVLCRDVTIQRICCTELQDGGIDPEDQNDNSHRTLVSDVGRSHELLSECFFCTQQPTPQRHDSVLVCDTPSSHYGLPRRLIQLNQISGQMPKSSSAQLVK